MKAKDARLFLKSLGATVPFSQPRTKWVVSDCPMAPWTHDKKKSSAEVFGVRLETGDAFCNCFACGWHGSQTDLVYAIKAKNELSPSGKKYDFGEAVKLISQADEEFELDLDTPDLEELLLAKKDLTVFDDWWIESFPYALDIEFARDYLDERGVPEHLTEQLNLRADTNQRRVCFPVKDFKGRYMGLHGRAVDPDVEPRYRMYTYKKFNNPDIWLGEQWIDFSLPLLIVEGPFDLTAAGQVWGNITSPLFANPSFEKLKRMAGAMEIISYLDRGTGGDKGRERISKAFPDSVVHHALPLAHRKDPGESTYAENRAALSPFLPV